MKSNNNLYENKLMNQNQYIPIQYQQPIQMNPIQDIINYCKNVDTKLSLIEEKINTINNRFQQQMKMIEELDNTQNDSNANQFQFQILRLKAPLKRERI